MAFHGLFLLFLLQVVPGCSGTVTVSGFKEEDVALMCLDPTVTDIKGYRARSLKNTTGTPKPPIIYEWPKKSQGSTRLALEAHDGRFCLFLKTLQKSDSGFYKCEIWVGWAAILVENISLKVKDCRTLQPVKAAPRSPAKLNCQVNITSGLQIPVNISWTMLKGDKPEAVDPERTKVNGTFLAFQSVTTNDSGWYRCTLEQTQRCSEINLHVTENVATTVPVTTVPTTTQQAPTTKEPGSDTSGPVVSSVVIGFFILVVSAAFFIYRRHKTQREAQTQLRHPTGCLVDSLDAYENLTLPRLQDSGNRVNSLYHCPEESMHTFQY